MQLETQVNDTDDPTATSLPRHYRPTQEAVMNNELASQTRQTAPLHPTQPVVIDIQSSSDSVTMGTKVHHGNLHTW